MISLQGWIDFALIGLIKKKKKKAQKTKDLKIEFASKLLYGRLHTQNWITHPSSFPMVCLTMKRNGFG